MELAGQVAIVTGGGRGIGRATALELARLGADIMIAELDKGGGGVSQETRLRLATKAFAHTAQYDAAVASYLARAARPSSPGKRVRTS